MPRPFSLSNPLTISAVLFPNFELLDVYGPLEMFGVLKDRVSITIIAEFSGEIASSCGPRGVADLKIADAPAADILLVPGGIGTRIEVENTSFLNALRIQAEKAGIVASVCTGSALLAKAGFLDGKRATSNKIAIDWVMAQGPRVHWVREARWVEDENLFTSSGVSAGMDMSLGIIEVLFGLDVSLEIARFAEYTWHRDKSVDPFANLQAPDLAN